MISIRKNKSRQIQAVKKDEIDRIFNCGAATANYLTHVSQKHGFVYVETPKVACTTIKRALQIIENDGSTDGLVNNVHDRKNSPLLNIFNAPYSVEQIFKSPDLFRFCFVRDPFTRIVSAYLDKLVINQWERNRRMPALGFKPTAHVSLKVFLKTIRAQKPEEMDIHWMPQSCLLRPELVHYDFIGRFDAFQAGFETVIGRIEPSFLEDNAEFDFSRHKTGASTKALDLIGEEEADLIRELYECDFEAFSFDRNWPPQ